MIGNGDGASGGKEMKHEMGTTGSNSRARRDINLH